MSRVPNDDTQSSTRSSQDRPDVDLISIPELSYKVVPPTPAIVAQEQAPTQLSTSISQERTRPMPPFPQHRGKDTTIIATILAILFTLSGTFLGTTAYNNQQSTIIASTIATARTYANATAIIAHATATAQAKILTNYPFSNDLVLNDPLSDSSNASKYGWDQAAACSFTNSAYQVTERQVNFIQPCTAVNTTFSNFTYEIQMVIKTGGTGAEGGMIFRANMSSDQLYIFHLGTDGFYNLEVRANSSGASSRTLKQGTISGFITGFNRVHTIGIVANGSQISVYVDHNQVTQIFDSTYSSGQIGVLSDYGSSTTVVNYNNAKVWLLP
jgi:hypothetical protein